MADADGRSAQRRSVKLSSDHESGSHHEARLGASGYAEASPPAMKHAIRSVSGLTLPLITKDVVGNPYRSARAMRELTDGSVRSCSRRESR